MAAATGERRGQIGAGKGVSVSEAIEGGTDSLSPLVVVDAVAVVDVEVVVVVGVGSLTRNQSNPTTPRSLARFLRPDRPRLESRLKRRTGKEGRKEGRSDDRPPTDQLGPSFRVVHPAAAGTPMREKRERSPAAAAGLRGARLPGWSGLKYQHKFMNFLFF